MTTSIHLALLGSWQLSINGKQSTKEPRKKVKALLAYLALESGQAHSRELLATLLWPDLAKSEGRNNLRVTLARLRKLLGHSELIEATRSEVKLNTDIAHRRGHTIDLFEFEDLVQQTESHEHDSLAQCETCLADLETAVSLYRGDFLAGFTLDGCIAFDEWQFVWRERMQVLVSKQLDRLARAMVANGRYAQAEQVAARHIAIDALNETAHRNLMTALYAQGRRTSALQKYQACAALLHNELGVYPDAETKALKTAIKDNSLSIGGAAQQRPTQPTQIVKLPEHLTPFFGREEELTLLSKQLAQQDYRLISLIGPGGIGKTRLAIQAARPQTSHFADGVYFVSLVGVQSHHDIPAAIGDALDIPLMDATPFDQQIVDVLANKALLLILDNFEHLIEGVPLLQAILAAAPQVVLLVTSRARLNLQSEDLFRLTGLPYPAAVDDLTAVNYAAVRLFGDRAHRLDKQFWLNEDSLPAVVRICQIVEGLPLGLELAATWIRDFSVDEIAAALAEDLALLQTDLRDVARRHQNIAAVFDYSWRLLSSDEQRVLPLLTLFKGGFQARAAFKLFKASPVALKRLRYKTLIRRDGNGRYALHELIRQMAAHKLPAEPRREQKRFVAHFLQQVQQNALRLRTSEAKQAAQRLTADIDNVRQAWQWGIELGLFKQLQETAGALAEYFIHVGQYNEGKMLIQQVLDTLPTTQAAASDAKRPFFLIELAYILSAQYHGTLAEQEKLFNEILQRTDGHPELKTVRARAYYYLSRALFVDSIDNERARDAVQQALRLAKQLDDMPLLADCYVQMGCLHYRFENTAAAVAEIRQGIDIYETLGDMPRLADGYGALAVAYAESGDMVKSFTIDKKLLAMFQELGSDVKVADQHFNMAYSYAFFGAIAESIPLVMKAMKTFARLNDRASIQNCHALLGESYFDLGDDEQSVRHYEQAMALQDELKLTSRLCSDLIGFSLPLWRTGQLDEAQQVLERAIDVSVAPRYTVQAEAQLAVVLLQKGLAMDALALAESLWQKVKASAAKGLPNVLRTLSCFHRVFVYHNQQVEAEAVLHLAQREIEKTAVNIDDAELRQTYLTKHPVVNYFKPHLSNSPQVFDQTGAGE
ncbi:MAG: BTAD domain-containing putative transcriptional regulator [Chloroflexota bacterium]